MDYRFTSVPQNLFFEHGTQIGLFWTKRNKFPVKLFMPLKKNEKIIPGD